MRYEGYCEGVPVQRGDVVTIRKGTRIRSTHPRRADFVAGRTYRVKVDHILHGASGNAIGSYPVECTNPTVRWAGVGGYWCWVDINDIPEAA